MTVSLIVFVTALCDTMVDEEYQ